MIRGADGQKDRLRRRLYARASPIALEISVSASHPDERRVSDNDTEAKHKRLLAIIRDGGRQSRSDITRRSQFLSRREREEIVASLIEAGLVVMDVEPGTTKPTAYYTATTPAGTALVRHGEP